MERYLDHITEYLLRQSWQIAVLVCAVAVASWLLRNRSAHVRYLLWLIVLAKCLVPPLLTFPLSILPSTEAVTVVPAETSSVTVSTPAEPELAGPEYFPIERPMVSVAEQRIPMFNARQWLGLAWLLGACMYVVVAIVRALRTSQWLRRNRTEPPDQLQSILHGLDVRARVKVWLIEGIGQPFVWGLVRGDIYLPGNSAKVRTSEHMRSILGHELGHVLRFDAAVNVLQVLAQAIFWFHPFVWWANKRIRAEREKCCDETAIARLGTRAKEYSTAIVETLVAEYESTRRVPSLAVAGPVKNIEERIKTMMRPGKKFYKRPTLIAATIVLVLAIVTVPTALVLTARAEVEAATEHEAKPTESLHKAVADRNIELVRKLIAEGADVNAKNERNMTPLEWGLFRSSLTKEVAELLTEKGANLNVQDEDGWSPLYGAIYVGTDKDILKLLVSRGADVNLATKKGETPLHSAVEMGDIDIVKLLVDKGADFNVKNQEGWTALRRAALSGRKDMFGLFVARGTDTSSFHMAAFVGDLDRVKAFVERGTEVDTKDEAGWTPLFWAACAGQEEVAQFLIDKNADINANDGSGRSLLHQAAQAQTDAVKLVALLIAKGADINAKDNSRENTPLHLACYSGNKEVADLLIGKGADIGVKDKNGHTPLHCAALAPEQAKCFRFRCGGDGGFFLAQLSRSGRVAG